MRRSGQRSRDVYKIRANNDQDRKYYVSGIPQRFWNEQWNLEPSNLVLQNSYGGEKPRILQTSVQKEAMATLMDLQSLSQPWRIGIGGEPTSDKAMAFACRIAKNAVDHGKKVHFIDPGSPRHLHEVEFNEELVVIYNLSPEHSTPERLMRVRDILVAVQDRLCLLVIDGNPDIYFHQLKFYKKALLYFTGPLVVTEAL